MEEHDTLTEVFDSPHEKGVPEWETFNGVADDKIKMYEVQNAHYIPRAEYRSYRRRFKKS